MLTRFFHNGGAFFIIFWGCFPIFIQAKTTLEKTKQSADQEKTDLSNDLRQVQQAKQESERKRKQLEQQLQETAIRYQDADRLRAESSDKLSKVQVG